MITAVIGSRNFTDYKLLESTLESLPEITQIVSGGAKGADSLAKTYAEQHQLPLVIFKPDWKQYGKGAGIVRNRQIIDAAQMVVAFWDEFPRVRRVLWRWQKLKGFPYILSKYSVSS